MLFVAGLLTSPASIGELYKWTDDQGKVHYGDTPPDNARLEKITGKVSSFTSVSLEPLKLEAKSSAPQGTAKSVVMYSTSWCGYCKQAARYFRRKGIAFTEYDIEKSAKGARDFRKLGGRGVPVILIGNRRMNGFEQKTFERIYYAKS